MVFLAGQCVTGLEERNLLPRSLDKTQSCLRMLQKTPPKKLPFTTSRFYTYTESHSWVYCSNIQEHIRQNGGKGLVCCQGRNPGLTQRKAENIGYVRLMRFSDKLFMVSSNF
jgi:hypothetical protein